MTMRRGSTGDAAGAMLLSVVARAVGVCVHIGKIIRKDRALRRMPHPARVT